MKKNFYVFRHGQTNKNFANVWQGSGLNEGLNANGLQQAFALAQKVRALGIEKIYSSSLVRAIQTATIVASEIPFVLPIVVKEDLRECYFGVCEGKTFDEVSQEYAQLVEVIFNPTFDNWHQHFPEAESKKQVFERVCACLKDIAKQDENTVGIVCHAGVLSALQCGFQLGEISFDNCSILHLQYDTETEKFEKID